MAKQIKKVVSKGLIRRQSDGLVTPSDTTDNDNALFPSDEYTGADRYEAANSLMVSAAGDVTVRLVRTDKNGDPIDSLLPGLAPGGWHNCEAFKQVMETGTTTGASREVKVAVTSYRGDPGVPGA